jgi:type 1 glutamine amidotransferase
VARALVLGGLTTGFHQFWINGPALREALQEAGFEALLSEDLEVLTAPGLAHYDLVVNYTTGRELSPAQWAGLEAFVRGGRGLVGVHNGADSFKNQGEYVALLGGVFVTHPPQLDIAVEYVDTTHAIVAGLPPFQVHDELYILDWRPERVHLLAQTRSHEGKPQPIAWVRQEGAGRVFYLSLGHNRSTFDDPTYRRFLGRGARWAAGLEVAAG